MDCGASTRQKAVIAMGHSHSLSFNTRAARTQALMDALAHRILVLDGAMGTMIQRHRLTEREYRGDRFANWKSDLRGNNDLLTLTRPEVIREIHGSKPGVIYVRR